MRKILINGLSSNNGGIESVIYGYTQVLLEEGYSVHFVKYEDYLSKEDDLVEWGCKVIRVTNRSENFSKYIYDLFKLLKKEQYDIVWDNRDSLVNMTFLCLSKLLGVKIRIIHGHTSSILGNKTKGWLHAFNKLWLRLVANHFWAASDLSAKFFFRKVILKDTNFKIISNCINFEEYSYDVNSRITTRQKLGIDITEKVLIINGRLGYPKNQALILDVLKRLNNDDNWKLILIGDGPDREMLEKKCKELDIDKRTLFLGMIPREKVKSYLNASDVFVMPSFNEGLPIALLEAQVNGLPCVISDVVSKQADITKSVYRLNPYDQTIYWANTIQKSYGKRGKAEFLEGRESTFDLKVKGRQLVAFLE